MGVEEVVEEELPVFEEQTEVARVVQMPMKWEEEWLEEDTEVGDDVICVLHLKNRLPIFVDDENFDYGFVTQVSFRNYISITNIPRKLSKNF